MTDSQVVSLVRIHRNLEHIRVLRRLLLSRSHGISHKWMPTYKQHREFVLSHPYRAWYLIKAGNEYVGTIYLLRSNNVGVSVRKGSEGYLEPAIRLLLLKYKPLVEIKSVRAAEFDFNVSPANRALIAVLKDMGASLTQVTYVLPLQRSVAKPIQRSARKRLSA